MKSLSWFLLPLSMFGLGVFLQGQIKGPEDLTLRKLERRLQLKEERDNHIHSKLLHLRIEGYNRADVLDLLKRLESDGQELYKTVLRWDLVFPVFYGVAFVVALLNLPNLAESHVSPLLCWLPIVSMTVADWTENSLLLAEIELFQKGSTLGIVPIEIASLATQTKLYTLGMALALLVYLFASTVYRNCRTQWHFL
jgi:hypothetical protein